jgi:hypothetical protein
MKNRKTKHGEVKNHLMTKGSITSLEAINLYNATRLSAIIYNLRHKEKLAIKSVDMKDVDCNGNTVIYAKYVYTKTPKSKLNQ